MSVTIIDTDILIDSARQAPEAISCLNKIIQKSIPAISVITQMELFVGCRNKTELRNTEHFLKRFQVVNLNDQSCRIAVDLLRMYRLSHGLMMPDALIVATAIFFGSEFITKNQQDYRFISGLQLLPYP